ncbi:MAG: hypothetical protein IKW61_05095, partial [Bacteroidaceae bacterium]|nr:hypothetical protein [Bacteroidaceae bacterium]
FTNIFSTTKMLIVQAMPESIIPFVPVNYEAVPGIMLWIFAIALLAIILYGFWNMGKLRWPLFFYFCGTIGIISLFNVPSEYRYLTSATPFLTMALFVGLWKLCEGACRKALSASFSPWILALLFLPAFAQDSKGNKHTIGDMHAIAIQKFPPQFNNFFALGKALATKNKNAIVCSRKPELLYTTSGLRGVHYLETEDDAKMIQNMLDKKVDFVLVEQLGFGSTYRYLIPCVQKHKEIFKVALHLPNPDTFLLHFDKKAATEWLKNSPKQ